jgi:hypothetical protein
VESVSFVHSNSFSVDTMTCRLFSPLSTFCNEEVEEDYHAGTRCWDTAGLRSRLGVMDDDAFRCLCGAFGKLIGMIRCGTTTSLFSFSWGNKLLMCGRICSTQTWCINMNNRKGFKVRLAGKHQLTSD